MINYFLKKIAFFSLIVIMLYGAASLIPSDSPKVKNDYMAAIIDKHAFSDKINTAKILFAGGSNVAFGINSPEIEKQVHMPVVNLGLQGGLGLSFMLEELKRTAKSGDIVFLSFEYFLNADGNYKLQKFTSNFYPPAKSYYTTNTVMEIRLHISETRKNLKSFFFHSKKIKSDLLNDTKEPPIYRRTAFNENGDVISHLDRKPPDTLKDGGFMKYRNWDHAIDLLNAFYEYANTTNIKVFFLYPPHPVSEFKRNKDIIEKFDANLSANLQIPIICKPIDFAMDDSLFFDTVYHLNKEGREKRTIKLITILKEVNKKYPFYSTVH